VTVDGCPAHKAAGMGVMKDMGMPSRADLEMQETSGQGPGAASAQGHPDKKKAGAGNPGK